MNVPAIRKALERYKDIHAPEKPAGSCHDIADAVVRVGLLACEEWDEANHVVRNAPRGFPLEGRELAAVARLSVIADILREAGVPVEVEK